jgi:hypothetical protein
MSPASSSEGRLLVGNISHRRGGGHNHLIFFQTDSNGETLNMKVIDMRSYETLQVITFLCEIILSMKFKFESLKFEFKFCKPSQMGKLST